VLLALLLLSVMPTKPSWQQHSGHWQQSSSAGCCCC
jgi:hypothetical protein